MITTIQNNCTLLGNYLGPDSPIRSQIMQALLKKQTDHKKYKLTVITFNSDSFEGVLVHLGPNFSDRMSLTLDKGEELLKSKLLQKVTTIIHKTDRKFDFSKNGFEFHDFTGTSLGSAIETMANGPKSWPDIPEATINNHAKAVEESMAAWGKKQKIPFSEVVWIDTVYRNTAGGKFGAVHFVHVDFPAEDSSATLKGHGDWKVRVVKKLGDMTTEAYEKLNISKIMNIWMPLDKHVEAEPLAIMDLESLKDPKKDLRIYEDQRITGGGKYLSVGVMPKEEHRWYIKNNMKMGEVVVFDSCHTPHTAVSLPDQGDKKRRSLECRVLFLK